MRCYAMLFFTCSSRVDLRDGARDQRAREPQYARVPVRQSTKENDIKVQMHM
jgi:hypothetical protein